MFTSQTFKFFAGGLLYVFQDLAPNLGNGAHIYLSYHFFEHKFFGLSNSAGLDRGAMNVLTWACRHVLAYNHPNGSQDRFNASYHRMNKRVWKVHIPSTPVVGVLKFFERLHIPLPIKPEQVLRLNENKDFSYEEAQRDFGFSPSSFEEGITLELKQV